tara:strand:+ start:3271 stop:3852 length:582 start_codon:yes stop_codon:yes gene_type:complete
MDKKNIFIINSKSLYDIFNEVKALFDFNVFEINKNDLEFNNFPVEPNSIFLSYSLEEVNKLKYLDKSKLIVLDNFPIPIIKIIEKINLLFLKINYQLKSEIKVKQYILNLNDKTIKKDEKKIKLTEKELEIILFLSSNQKPQKTLNLQKKIWKYKSDLETHTVETHIYRLRKKIETEFKDAKFISSNQEGYFF